MGREQATRIIEILEKAGFPAYFVGGCVRDTLLGESRRIGTLPPLQGRSR